ncbi:MAG: response regulator [Clostridia bacterium]|nr:response regulator [Clostridia bacterium]
MNAKKVILVVDDTVINLTYASEVLDQIYKVIPAKSGIKALELLEKITPDLILLDIEMPEMDGYETIKKIKNNPKNANIPVIFLTAHSDKENELTGFKLGAVDFITKPFVPEITLARIATQIELSEYRNNLEMLVRKKTEEVETISLQAIMAIANTVDAKDVYTRQHSMRVAKYSREIAKRLSWDEDAIDQLYNLALLHDIGKIGIPDAILNKPGRLTDEEFTIMKTHTKMGADILKDITMIKDVAKGALYHHERYDGRGYMQGLVGEDIPIVARIVGIADAYDAMTSDRAYRKKLPMDVVRAEIEKGRNTQFDGELVDIMLSIIDDGIDFPDE